MTVGALSNLVSWSLQMLLVVAAGGALPWLLRLRDPAVRHGYWRVLLLVCLTLPVAQPWQPVALSSVELDLLAAMSPDVMPEGRTGAVLPRISALRLDGPAERWATTIVILLAAGAAVRLAWLAAGLLRLRRLRRAGDPPRAEDEQGDLPALRSAGAEIRYVQGIGQPVTFGVLSPVVLLPQSLRSQVPTIQRAVLVHEMWHVRRRDWTWVVVEEVVRSVFWFHPAVGWLVSRVQSSREEVVDELTVLSTNARRSYLEALLAFADQPGAYPATPFARRRHLFQRMLLISREAVMSSRRVVASCAAMGAVVLVGTWLGVEAFPLREVGGALAQGQPRDLRPGEPRPASSRELEIKALLNSGAPTSGLYLELAKLQEERGALAQAEATLSTARTTLPNEANVLMALAGLYQRSRKFAEAMEATEQVASMRPSDARVQHLAATFYEEKVRKDPSLPGDVRERYLEAGIAAEDRALALTPDYLEALIIKNLLLRHQASVEGNPARQRQLIAAADQLRSQALELQKRRRRAGTPQPGAGAAPGSAARTAPPPPPPPPPPPADAGLVGGQTPLRLGGDMKPPLKIKNVSPVYPPDAKEARVTGVVIIEATIDAAGLVRDTRVIQSVPLLDEAAVEAVRQWEFTPTLVNGEPVPVVVTITVNFTLK